MFENKYLTQELHNYIDKCESLEEELNKLTINTVEYPILTGKSWMLIKITHNWYSFNESNKKYILSLWQKHYEDLKDFYNKQKLILDMKNKDKLKNVKH